MQIIRSRLNAVGWWGLAFVALPLPALGGIYAMVQDSNAAQIRLAQVIDRDPSSLKLMEVSPWVLAIMGAVFVLGAVMMVIGRNAYVQDISK